MQWKLVYSVGRSELSSCHIAAGQHKVKLVHFRVTYGLGLNNTFLKCPWNCHNLSLDFVLFFLSFFLLFDILLPHNDKGGRRKSGESATRPGKEKKKMFTFPSFSPQTLQVQILLPHAPPTAVPCSSQQVWNKPPNHRRFWPRGSH